MCTKGSRCLDDSKGLIFAISEMKETRLSELRDVRFKLQLPR